MKQSLHFFIVLVFCICAYSCTKEQALIEGNFNQVDVKSLEEGFSIILSKAIYDSEPLRIFLRNESLKQFDNDYDVLYGKVKDCIVYESLSFRDILLCYCDSEEQLLVIEKSLPLLCIYVPNLTWLSKEGFSAETWDTSDNEIAVTYREGNSNNDYFGNGDLIVSLPEDMVPAFPLLVVKNNERVRVSKTKGSEYEYVFIDDAFNGSLTRGGTQNYSGVAYPTMVGNSPTITASELRMVSGLSLNAFDEFGSNSPIACQRDFCYYGMSNANLNNGVLDRSIFERLFRFKLSFNAISFYDDETAEDPVLRNGVDTIATHYKGDNSIEELSSDELQVFGALLLTNAGFFYDGNLELLLTVTHLSSSGLTASQNYYFSIPPYDLFEFNEVDFSYLHASFWRKAQYTYVFRKSNIISKWYYPEQDILLMNWSLASISTSYMVKAVEQDSGNTYTTTNTLSWGMSSNVTVTTGNDEIKTATGIGSTTSFSVAMTVSNVAESDDFGSYAVEYEDDIILNRQIASADTLYTLRSYGSNMFNFCVIPVDAY